MQARLDQLRGDTETAVNRYVSFRYAEGLLESNSKTPIPAEATDPDLYATQFLALASSDRGWGPQARDLFLQTLKLFPEPGPGQPYFNMFRCGPAPTSVGSTRTRASRCWPSATTARRFPTSHSIGDRLRARLSDLVRPLRSLRRPALTPPAARADVAGLPTRADTGRPVAPPRRRLSEKIDDGWSMTDGRWSMRNDQEWHRSLTIKHRPSVIWNPNLPTTPG